MSETGFGQVAPGRGESRAPAVPQPTEPRRSVDPNAELLVEESRERVERPLSGRERIGEALAGTSFLVAATALAVVVPWDRDLSIPLTLTLVAAFAVALLVRFEVGACHTNAAMLVFVPMLFLLPTPCVPLAVAAGGVLGYAPDYLRGRRHTDRTLVSIADSWYAIGPAAVLGLAHAGAPAVADWPLYAAALASQLVVDLAVNTPREMVELGVRPRLQVAQIAVTFAVDAILAGVGLLAALASVRDDYAFLLVLPLMVLLAVFARERTQRLDKALQLSEAYRGTTRVLAELLERDDGYTGEHSRGLVPLALATANELGLDPAQRRNVEFGALLHDIGKIVVPNEVINKAGPLTDEEWALMKTHTVEGERILSRVGGTLAEVGGLVRSSHERWDGGGYPDGLAGERIPLEARIISCCDAFHAMTTNRPYRPAMTTDVAVQELRDNAGSQFDPRLVEALIEVLREEPVADSPLVALERQLVGAYA